MANHTLPIGYVAEPSADIEYKIASTRDEREAAFRLVYNAYLRAGLSDPNRFRMRVTPFHLLSDTRVFIARHEGEVISTVTLVCDADLGLPMEIVFGNEVSQLRKKGLRLGEVTCLADRRRDFNRSVGVFVGLCRLMIQTARSMGLAETLVAVHPRHSRFYRRFCAFEPIGSEATYPTVRGHPAIAMSLNFERLDREGHGNYETFFGQRLPDSQLHAAPMSLQEREYFSSMIDPTFLIVPMVPATNTMPPRAMLDGIEPLAGTA